MVLQVQIRIFSRKKVSDLEDGVLQAGVRARVWGAGQVDPDATVLTLQCRGASRKVFLQGVFLNWFRPKSSKCWSWQNPYQKSESLS